MSRTRIGLHEIFQKLNMVLAVSAVVLGLYFFISLLRPVYVIPSGLNQSGRGGLTLSKADPLQEVTNFSFALFRSKKLFPAHEGRITPDNRHQFTLIGVSFGEKALAVIRDTTSGKTYYCSTGDYIEDFLVVSITKEKVTVDRNGSLRGITR